MKRARHRRPNSDVDPWQFNEVQVQLLEEEDRMCPRCFVSHATGRRFGRLTSARLRNLFFCMMCEHVQIVENLTTGVSMWWLRTKQRHSTIYSALYNNRTTSAKHLYKKKEKWWCATWQTEREIRISMPVRSSGCYNSAHRRGGCATAYSMVGTSSTTITETRWMPSVWG